MTEEQIKSQEKTSEERCIAVLTFKAKEQERLQTFLANLEQKPYSDRSAEEIDAYIEEMRNSWDE